MCTYNDSLVDPLNLLHENVSHLPSHLSLIGYPDLPSVQPSVITVVQPSDTLSVTAHDQPSIQSVVHNRQAMVHHNIIHL